MTAILRTAAAWVYTALYLPIFAALYVVSLRSWPASWLQAVIRLWGRSTLGILGIRLEAANSSTLETREPRILIMNHTSALDIIVGAALCPPAPLAIGKKEVIWIPFLNLVWWALDFIRIDRSHPAEAIASLRHVAQAINSGSRSLLIAPEGTRSPDGTLLPFKKGAFHIAVQSRAPICPVAVLGAFELMPKQTLIARGGVIRVRFLDPFPSSGISPEGLEPWINEVREGLRQALRDLGRKSAG